MKKYLPVFLLLSFFATSCATYQRSSASYLLHGPKRYSIVKTARKYIGVKYKFGGESPAGFDCSGYSRYVYKKNGLLLPHSAQQQYARGKRIGIRKARPGDLVFFRISGWKISHVGIYMGDYTFLHAPRRGKRVSYEDIRKNYWRKRYAGTVTYF
ncbi:MAG TPA: C40 family peptidase [Spirochaetota bacterium]|nr:C40 family peptidase [Spirochaetota bacterium]HPJ33888.1 C40 family peptidase [Spirochaetota bacterium]